MTKNSDGSLTVTTEEFSAYIQSKIGKQLDAYIETLVDFSSLLLPNGDFKLIIKSEFINSKGEFVFELKKEHDFTNTKES